jgi:SAM-dependent methyltransferase
MGRDNASCDKLIERERYNRRALEQLDASFVASLGLDGAAALPLEIQAPYRYYENVIGAAVRPRIRVLDICCGNGVHTIGAARLGGDVTACDLAESNLELVERRAHRAGLKIKTVVADAEALPFAEGAFDLVTCAGSLSYVQLDLFLREVTRVLRPGGIFVCVDSLNHNPIYRFNRFVHFLRGHRSRSTLRRIPDRRTLLALKLAFPDLVVKYFGVGSFLMPPVRFLFGSNRAARFNDWMDEKLPFARDWAFKIVAHGHLPYRAT